MALTIDQLAAQYGGGLPGGGYSAWPSPAPFLSPWFTEPVPESAQVDPMLGLTAAFGAAPTAPAQYGYNPQPRPALPAPLTAEVDTAGFYGPFRNVWEGLRAEPDPLAALMQRPAPEVAPAPRVPELPYEPIPPYVPPQPTRAERWMGQQRPGVMERLNWLRALRARQGF